MRETLDSFGDTFGESPRNVDVVTLVAVRGGSNIPTIDTVVAPDTTVAWCFMDNNTGARGC